MPDERIQNLAKTIVNFSTRVEPGDMVAIRGFPLTPAATPLIMALTVEVLEAGGLPHLLMTPPEYQEVIINSANDVQLGYANPFLKMVMEHFDVDIRITSAENTKTLSSLEPGRLNKVRAAYYDSIQTWMQRQAEGSLRWLTSRYPTRAYAQQAELSLREYEDFFYSSCFADCEDPIDKLKAMRDELETFANIFRGGTHVQLSGPHIDLSLSIEGRNFKPCFGDNNLPDGEIYCGPIRDSVEGWAHFSFPCIYQGVQVEGAELVFKAGKVVEARAQKHEDFLLKTVAVDAGASYLGEFGIGLNSAIDRFTGDMLFDEKIAGTIHLALGAGYPQSGSQNESAIHWDLLVDMRQDSEILLDGELIYKDGAFV